MKINIINKSQHYSNYETIASAEWLRTVYRSITLKLGRTVVETGLLFSELPIGYETTVDEDGLAFKME
jgi:hypothetical protein